MGAAAINFSSPFQYLQNSKAFASNSVKKIENVAIGVLATIAEFPILGFAYNKIIDFMKMLALDVSKPQDAVALLHMTHKIKSTFLTLLFKTALIGYIVIGGPILEEYLFRGILHDKLRSWISNPDSIPGTILRVSGNGFIFGACHLSPYQGWMNVPIFFVTFMLGCVFATLRETTGDLTASTTAHILHNGVAVAGMLLL